MADALTIVTSIVIVLLVGLIVSWIGAKLKIPDVLLLVLTGMLLGFVSIDGFKLIDFPPLFLASIGIIALALIIFDSMARVKLREFDSFSLRTLKLVFIFTILVLVLFSAAAHYLAGFSWSLAILLATIIAGTSPDIVLTLFPKSKHHFVELMKLESVFNTPLTVILPFIVLDFLEGFELSVAQEFMQQFTLLLTKFVVGIGAGVIIALILLKIMKKAAKTRYGYLAIVVAALLSYVLAENLGGNGVLAVMTLGMFFGNSTVKGKFRLLRFEGLLAKTLYIFVFVLLGLVIKLPLELGFYLKSLALFGIYLLIRFLAIWISERHAKIGELVFVTLNASKGVATATVVFTLAIIASSGALGNLPDISPVLDYSLAIILYSIILAAIAAWSSKKLIGEKVGRGLEKKL